jgi:hypothetical protein
MSGTIRVAIALLPLSLAPLLVYLIGDGVSTSAAGRRIWCGSCRGVARCPGAG